MAEIKVLVTGGSGFIGGNLVKRLNELGYIVRTMDFHSEDYPCDISYLDSFEPVYEWEPDIIYHLAGQSYGRGGLLDPYKDLNWNAKGTLNVCEFTKKLGTVHRIIYTSTMAVYGDEELSEEIDLPNPLSNYGTTKLTGEHYIKQLDQHGIGYTIFRLFNTYGPGQDLAHTMKGLVSAMLSQVLNGFTINVTGHLSRFRDLTYIDDCVDALIMGMEYDTHNETFNLCSGRKTTVDDLINMLIDISGKEHELFDIKNTGSHYGDQYGNTGNNKKLTTVGWKPKVTLEEGLKKFYKYAEENV